MVEYNDFDLPVVDTEQQGGELHQGVYRTQNMAIPDGTLSLYVVILGYLVQCWSKVCHPGPVKPVAGPIPARGQGEYDFSQHAGVWEVDLVTIDLVKIPDGIDLQFGSPNLVYVGKGAFFRSALGDTQLDWSLAPRAPINSGFYGEIEINKPATWGSQLTTGMTPLTPDTVQNGAWDTGVRPMPQTGHVAGFFSYKFGERPKQKTLSARISNKAPYYYPLLWFNHMKMAFKTPDVMANGFMWNFKPGVEAIITLYGRPTDPHVTAGSGEGSHAGFNPMAGGQL